MGIPLAALGVRTPQFKSPLDQMTKAVQLKSLLQRQEVGQLELEQHKQAQKDQQIFRKAYMEAQGDPKKTIELAVRAGVSPQLISQYRDSITKSRKALEDLDEATLDNAAKRNDAIGGAFQAVLGLPEQQREQAYAQVRGQLIQSGVIRAQEAPEQYPGDEFMRVGALSSMSSKEQIAAERQRRVDKEAKRYHEALEEKESPSSRQKEFADFYKAYRESKGLPRNAKIEMQARNAFAKLRRAPSTDKPPDPKVKIRAQEVKDRSMARAVENYGKRMKELEKTWLQDETTPEEGGKGEWINRNTGGRISNDEYLAKRREAEDELVSAQEQADLSYLEKIGTAGFESGLPVDYRAQARARRGKEIPVPTADVQDGQIAINPTTGERLVNRGGKWVPVPK